MILGTTLTITKQPPVTNGGGGWVFGGRTLMDRGRLQQGGAINKHLLMSDTRHFSIEYQINPYMQMSNQPDRLAAETEHRDIVDAHIALGRSIEYAPSAPGCPDMVYTANAALVSHDRAVLGQPPVQRQREMPHFRSWLCARGFEVIDAPFPFSGQGDALPCGDLLLAGYGQRTDRRMHGFLARILGYDVVSLRTVSPRWYDIDLVVAIIRPPNTVAYCPQALDAASRGTIRSLGLDLIEVTPYEAERFALNLVSDGSAVTMTRGAPRLAATLRDRGLQVVELSTTQLRKGGGGVRCTSLTLDNAAPRHVLQLMWFLAVAGTPRDAVRPKCRRHWPGDDERNVTDPLQVDQDVRENE